MIREINIVQIINAPNIANIIKNPPPRASPSDGNFTIIPMTELGMIEIENDVANAANASFRFVKLLFETKPYTIKATNARKKIIPISDICYIHLIHSLIKP